MIGDGYNDSLALQQAKVGIAVKGGVDLALKSADVFFLEEGLSSLLSLLRISAKARRQIHANLISAIVYNSLGGLPCQV
jgi:P-type E1-E2 ATPase